MKSDRESTLQLTTLPVYHQVVNTKDHSFCFLCTMKKTKQKKQKTKNKTSAMPSSREVWGYFCFCLNKCYNV